MTLDDSNLSAGDRFNLHFDILNTGMPAWSCDVYILLDVWGSYWFWPSWTSFGTDMKRFDLPADGIASETVLSFDWPADTGSATGLVFWGAMFDAGTWTLSGEVQRIVWDYS